MNLKHIMASLLLLAAVACGTERKQIEDNLNIIPQPSSVKVYDARLNVSDPAFWVDDRLDTASKNALQNFAQQYSAASGS